MLQKALVYSMEISDLEGMEKAIQAGADVKLKNKDGYNPLMLAPSPKTALFVLEHGGNLDDLDFAFRLKPTHKMAVRKAIEKRLQEKSLLTLLKRDSREI
ncbi:MAG: hypothetical protein J6S61_02300 [Elusimicrobiaceae bacterium]|nr:hypothetical protein [Elusimicrobiaceae bacterium]